MFYDIFKELCNDRGETPNSVATKLGFSQAAAPYWKKSGRPPKREALEKISEYFGCSVEYLLGRNPTVADIFGIVEKSYEKENAPAKHSRSEALIILGKLTDSELDEVLDFAEHLLLKRQSQEQQVSR
jgi:transcriptional regulator with XRE-family HTH domain